MAAPESSEFGYIPEDALSDNFIKHLEQYGRFARYGAYTEASESYASQPQEPKSFQEELRDIYKADKVQHPKADPIQGELDRVLGMAFRNEHEPGV